MQKLFLVWVSVIAGCNGGAVECGEGTHEEDGVCVSDSDDTDTDTDAPPGGHPLAPENYKWLWNVEGDCETRGKRKGNQVYILAEDVRVEADGTLSGTEKWYWFMAGEGWEGDCVDTFEVTGVPKSVDKAQYQCSQCEESYEFSRKLVGDTCGRNYDYFLLAFDWDDWEDPGDVEAYNALVLMDTLNPNGNPNEDNKMLLVQAKADVDGNYQPDWVDNDFARGHAVPDDPSEPGPPGTYDWLAEKCIRTSF